MSDFLGTCICRSHLLEHAEPLPGKGSTCEGYCIELYGRQYFLKKLKSEFRNNPVYISLFTKEFTVGKSLSHPNIINYVKMETNEAGVCMLMDYVAGKTVQEILTSEPGYFLSEKNLRRFLNQLLKGLADLHGNKYRILSEKDSTCQTIGHKHISEKASANLILEPKVTHFGKTYRVISIATSAFEYDTLLRSVFIPEGIENIGPRTFKACKKIISLTLPDTMKNLGEDCFSNNTTLERVVLPNGLGTLENNMFENCTSLKDIIIPEGIETIDRDCFINCTSLSYIKLPATLKTISRGVFYNCSALKEITIPASVTTIGDYAFLFCNSLTDIYNLAETPQIVAEIFNQEHLTIHVPAGSVDDYRTIPPWNMYDIVPIE